MATVQLPTRTDLGLYRMEVDLDGATFQFAFRFNEREGFWYFDLADADGEPIKSGVKVVTGFPLARLVRDLRRPPGEFTAVDTADTDREAGLEDLGDEVVLNYTEAADLPG
jgi:hypothetical protein